MGRGLLGPVQGDCRHLCWSTGAQQPGSRAHYRGAAGARPAGRAWLMLLLLPAYSYTLARTEQERSQIPPCRRQQAALALLRLFLLLRAAGYWVLGLPAALLLSRAAHGMVPGWR